MKNEIWDQIEKEIFNIKAYETLYYRIDKYRIGISNRWVQDNLYDTDFAYIEITDPRFLVSSFYYKKRLFNELKDRIYSIILEHKLKE